MFSVLSGAFSIDSFYNSLPLVCVGSISSFSVTTEYLLIMYVLVYRFLKFTATGASAIQLIL